jgi:hypothetical protein
MGPSEVICELIATPEPIFTLIHTTIDRAVELWWVVGRSCMSITVGYPTEHTPAVGL